MTTLRASRQERGSVFVETALVFTTLAFMLIGAFDFGQFLFIHHALVERAREAARWGIINDPTDLTSVQNMVLYKQASAPRDGTQGYCGLQASMVQVSDPGAGTGDYRLVVFITNYPYTILSPTIGGTYIGPNITISYPIGQ